MIKAFGLMVMALLVFGGSSVSAQIVPGYIVTPFASVTQARGVSTDAAGNVYTMERDGGKVYKIDPTGVSTVLVDLPDLVSGYIGPHFEPVSGNLYVGRVDAGAGTEVLEITSTGGVTTLNTAPIPSPSGLTSDAAGNLYVTTAFSNGEIYKVTPGGAVSLFATGLNLPDGLVFGPGGDLFIGQRGTNQIMRVPSTGGVATVYPIDNATESPFNLPLGITYDGNGKLYVANFGSGTISVISRSTDSRILAGVTGTGFTSLNGLTFDPSGNLFVADFGANQIFKISPEAPPEVPGNFVSKWSGEETANDSYGTNDGTWEGGIPTYEAGVVGQAFKFDGSSMVRITDSKLPTSNLNITGEITISAWFQSNYTGGGQIILTKLDNNLDITSYQLHMNTNGSVVASFYDPTTNPVTGFRASAAAYDPSNPYNDGEWHQAVAVLERGSDSLLRAKLFIDGEPGNSFNAIPNMGTTALDVSIGGRKNPGGSPSNYFRGLIDEVGIYDIALSENEIVAIYNQENPENANQLPVAYAGTYQPVECTGPTGTSVTLDGSGSSDPDGDALTYAWSAPGITFDDATSATPTGTFPLGTTTVSLTVDDGNGGSATDEVEITVEDNTVPEVTAALEQTRKPRGQDDDDDDDGGSNGYWHQVVAQASDICDEDPSVTAWITQPLTDADTYRVKYKRTKNDDDDDDGGQNRNRIDIKIGDKKIDVTLRGPSRSVLEGLLADAIAQGGFGVVDGQVLSVKSKDPKKGGDDDDDDDDDDRKKNDDDDGDKKKKKKKKNDDDDDDDGDRKKNSKKTKDPRKGTYKYEFDGSLVLSKAEGLSLALVVTAEDGSGNVSDPVTATPPKRRRSKPVLSKPALADASGGSDGALVFGASNAPNPFNPETVIAYVLPEGADVKLVIYNVLGQQVRELVNASQGPGQYHVRWDSRDGLGRSVSSGVYFYRLVAGPNVALKRMLLLK